MLRLEAHNFFSKIVLGGVMPAQHFFLFCFSYYNATDKRKVFDFWGINPVLSSPNNFEREKLKTW